MYLKRQHPRPTMLATGYAEFSRYMPTLPAGKTTNRRQILDFTKHIDLARFSQLTNYCSREHHMQ